MGLIPNPASLLAQGATRFFHGLRVGDQRMLLSGAAMAALGLWRRSAKPKKVLLARETVRPGQSLVIRHGSDQARVEVRRIDD